MNIDSLAPRLLKARPGSAAGKGRGVFAAVDIEPGETVDVAPSIELDEHTCDRIAGTRVDDYYFRHPGDETAGLLVFGLPSLCNHSDHPNTETHCRHVPELGWLVALTASRAIRAGEEITRRYACPPWFEAAR